MKTVLLPLVASVAVLASAGCNGDAQAMTPQHIEEQYGVSGAYTDTVKTADGNLSGTLVPVTLADGHTAHLFIPAKAAKEPHAVYLRDGEGLHPVSVKPNATREEVTRAPAVIEKQPEPVHANKRSWEKEALIIGGSAGAGTVIGAGARGKKRAGIGAAPGGIRGVVFHRLTPAKKKMRATALLPPRARRSPGLS